MSQEDEDTIDGYLELACSPAIPHGGRNKELAMHLLHQVGGSVKVSKENVWIVMQLFCLKCDSGMQRLCVKCEGGMQCLCVKCEDRMQRLCVKCEDGMQRLCEMWGWDATFV